MAESSKPPAWDYLSPRATLHLTRALGRQQALVAQWVRNFYGTHTLSNNSERSFADRSSDLDERPGKVVGKPRHRTPRAQSDWLVAQFHAMGLKLPFPKGVFRFKTFEQADKWEWDNIMKAAKKKSRDRQNTQT